MTSLEVWDTRLASRPFSGVSGIPRTKKDGWVNYLRSHGIL